MPRSCSALADPSVAAANIRFAGNDGEPCEMALATFLDANADAIDDDAARAITADLDRDGVSRIDQGCGAFVDLHRMGCSAAATTARRADR